MKDTETLLEYADRERKTDPWWEDVYQILADNDRRLKAAPEVDSPRPPIPVQTSVPVPSKVCAVCGGPFTAKRSDAAYCGRKCRQKAAYQAAKDANQSEPRPEGALDAGLAALVGR